MVNAVVAAAAADDGMLSKMICGCSSNGTDDSSRYSRRSTK